MSDYRLQVVVDVDVTNCDSESQARQAVFSLLGTPPVTTKGRPASGPRAVVTGLKIDQFSDRLQEKREVME